MVKEARAGTGRNSVIPACVYKAKIEKPYPTRNFNSPNLAGFCRETLIKLVPGQF